MKLPRSTTELSHLKVALKEARQEAWWWMKKYIKVAEGIEKICQVKQPKMGRTSRCPDALLTYVTKALKK